MPLTKSENAGDSKSSPIVVGNSRVRFDLLLGSAPLAVGTNGFASEDSPAIHSPRFLPDGLAIQSPKFLPDVLAIQSPKFLPDVLSSEQACSPRSSTLNEWALVKIPCEQDAHTLQSPAKESLQRKINSQPQATAGISLPLPVVHARKTTLPLPLIERKKITLPLPVVVAKKITLPLPIVQRNISSYFALYSPTRNRAKKTKLSPFEIRPAFKP